MCLLAFSRTVSFIHYSMSFQLLEAKKLAEVSNQIARIQEVSRRKQNINNQFKNQTKEQLDNKMENHTEKRESIINDIKEKIKVCWTFYEGFFKLKNIYFRSIQLKSRRHVKHWNNRRKWKSWQLRKNWRTHNNLGMIILRRCWRD